MDTHRQGQESECSPRGLAPADLPQSREQGAVQGAEENPQAAIPTASLAEPPHDETEGTSIPMVPLDHVPQPFSQSPWARRNARAKRWSQCIPKPFRILLSFILRILHGLWYLFAFAAVLTSPGLLTMLVGNAICKAASLPHFASIEAPIAVGVLGGFFGTLVCCFFIVPVMIFGEWMEKQFKERNLRSGRVSHDSERKDSHFPGILLWIPLLFFGPCLLSGPLGITLTLAVPGVSDLSKADVAKMSAIGGAIVAPGWIIGASLTYGIAEITYLFLYVILKGWAKQGEPEMLPYLWRQGEAFLWLFLPVRRQSLSPFSSTSV